MGSQRSLKSEPWDRLTGVSWSLEAFMNRSLEPDEPGRSGRQEAAGVPVAGRLRRRQKWERCALPLLGSLGMQLCPVAGTHAQAS